MKVMTLMLIMIQNPVRIMTNKLTKTVPPKQGPTPQGLNINYKKGKTLTTENKWLRLTKRYPTLNKQ